MNYEDYLKDALEMVLAWDLPEEELADAVNDQARLMAGVPPEEIRPRQAEQYSSSTY